MIIEITKKELKMFNELNKNGFLVKGKYELMEDYIRVSIGTMNEMKLFCSVFESML